MSSWYSAVLLVGMAGILAPPAYPQQPPAYVHRSIAPKPSVPISRSIPRSISPAPRSSIEECGQAQVLSIQGRWVGGAEPSFRPLGKADCLKAGEIVALAPDAQSGEITIIYHSADIPPHTIKCSTRAECNNAYQVEDVSTKPPASWWEDLTRFLQREKSRRVPGILRGSIDLQPGVLCSERGKIDLAPVWRLNGLSQSDFEEIVLTPLEAHVYVGTNGIVDSAWPPTAGTAVSIANIQYPMSKPAVYHLETVKMDGEISGSTIVLVAPQSMCGSLTTSYAAAVDYTRSWSADTPADAVSSFRAAYLQGLVVVAPKDPRKDARTK